MLAERIPDGIIARRHFSIKKIEMAEILGNLSSVCILIMKSRFLAVE
jgi:hypothetical protein